jgi:hypothetical protein
MMSVDWRRIRPSLPAPIAARAHDGSRRLGITTMTEPADRPLPATRGELSAAGFAAGSNLTAALTFGLGAWCETSAGIRTGEFDHPDASALAQSPTADQLSAADVAPGSARYRDRESVATGGTLRRRAALPSERRHQAARPASTGRFVPTRCACGSASRSRGRPILRAAAVPGVSAPLRSAGRFYYDLRIACLMICGTDDAMVVSEAGR